MKKKEKSPKKRRFPIKKILIALAVVLSVSTMILIACVLLLPLAVSSERSRNFIEQEASRVVNRPVRIKALEWTWSDGFMIEDVSVGDDPAFSDKPLFVLKKAGLKIDYAELADRAIGFSFIIDGAEANVVRNEDGVTNLEKLLSEIEAKSQKKEKKPQKKPKDEKISIPVDIRCKIGLKGISLTAEDRMLKKKLAVRNTSVFADMPSLLEKPVAVTISSHPVLDGRELSQVSVNLNAKDIFTSGGELEIGTAVLDFDAKLPGAGVKLRCDMPKNEIKSSMSADLAELAEIAGPFLPPSISGKKIAGGLSLELLVKEALSPGGAVNITGAYVKTEAKFPGGSFSADGGLSKQKMSGSLEVDLRKTVKMIKPFLPEPVAGTKVSGGLEFTFAVSGTKDIVSLDADIKAKQLRASGGPIPKGVLGPVKLDLSIRGNADMPAGKLSISKLKLNLLENTELFASCDVAGILGETKNAELHMGGVRVDLGEIVGIAGPFLPEDFSYFPDIENRPPVLAVKSIDMSGTDRGGPTAIDLKGLTLFVPEANVEAKPNRVSVNDLSFSVDSLKCALSEFFPEQVELEASAKIDKVLLAGEQEISVNGINLPKIAVKSKKIEKSDKSLFGLATELSIVESLGVDEVEALPFAQLKDLKQSLNINAVLRKTKSAKITVEDFSAMLPSVKVEDGKRGKIETSANMSCSVPKIRISSLDPPKIDVEGVSAEFSAGDYLKAVVKADLANLGKKSFRTDGNVVLRLSPLGEKILAAFLEKADLSGEADLGWNVSGRLPNEDEMKKFEAMSAIDLKKDLAFLDELVIDCTADNIGADIELPGNGAVKLGPVSTETPARYAFDGETGGGKFSAGIAVKNIVKIPSFSFEKPVSLDILLEGEHDGVKSLTLTQSLKMEPLHLRETLDVSLSGLDQVVEKDLRIPPALWLRHMGGRIRCNVDISKGSGLGMVMKDIDIDGSMRAGAGIRFSPGRTAGFNAWAHTDKINILAKELAEVKGLQTGLDVERNWRLVFGGKSGEAAKLGGKSPLSVEVLEIESGVSGAGASSAPVSRFMDKIQSRYGAGHTISFKSAKSGAGPFPIEVGSCDADLDISGLPGLDHFQADLLGGTVMGALAFVRNGKGYALRAQISFSGLDTRKLSTGKRKAEKDEDAELTGRLTLFLPLETSMDALLRQLSMNLQFSHIGSQSLEWLLYSLDPTESDETITSQRRLLSNGSPRWISVNIKDGGFSLDGEIDVKGLPVAIPRIDRMNISDISGLAKYEKHLAAMAKLTDALKYSSASMIVINEKGEIEFR